MITAALAGIVVVVGLVVMAVNGILEWPVAVQFALSALSLAVLAMAVLTVRRADGKALRIDNRVKRQEATLAQLRTNMAGLAKKLEAIPAAGRAHTESVVAALGEDRAELATHTAQLAEQTRRLAGQAAVLDGQTERLDTAGERLAEIRTSLAQVEGLIRDQVLRSLRSHTEYDQIEAMVDLRGLFQTRAPMPRLRGWAASPDVLRLLVQRIAADGPKLVVECGSGASSIWLGYALERFGGGRVVALEHEERFADSSRDLVAAHGLEAVVEVRHAPLTAWGEHQWYDTAALADLSDAGLVFIDGPPQSLGKGARYPAVPLLLPHCAADAWLVLDDTSRPDEREVAERWLEEYPELSRTVYAAEKGAMVFRRSAL